MDAEKILLQELTSNLDYDIKYEHKPIKYQNDELNIDNSTSELEGIQILDINRLYISVTYHELDSQLNKGFDRDQLIQVAW